MLILYCILSWSCIHYSVWYWHTVPVGAKLQIKPSSHLRTFIELKESYRSFISYCEDSFWTVAEGMLSWIKRHPNTDSPLAKMYGRVQGIVATSWHTLVYRKKMTTTLTCPEPEWIWLKISWCYKYPCCHYYRQDFLLLRIKVWTLFFFPHGIFCFWNSCKILLFLAAVSFWNTKEFIYNHVWFQLVLIISHEDIT